MGDSSRIDVGSYIGALSKREVSLLSRWERERRSVVTLRDIKEQVGPDAAPEVVRTLMRKRALQRIGRGRYLVRPFRTLSRPMIPSTPVMLEALLGEVPHYLGGLWALSFHGLTEQRYASIVDAFVTRRRTARQLGAAKVRFHLLPAELFRYGVMSATIEGLQVRLSDRERTFVDAFDHPRLFGGLERALELARVHLARLDRTRVLTYAVAGSKPSTCQRLGVLLEREPMPPRALAALWKKARTTRSLLSLHPQAPRTGRLNRRWNVVENDPR